MVCSYPICTFGLVLVLGVSRKGLLCLLSVVSITFLSRLKCTPCGVRPVITIARCFMSMVGLQVDPTLVKIRCCLALRLSMRCRSPLVLGIVLVLMTWVTCRLIPAKLLTVTAGVVVGPVVVPVGGLLAEVPVGVGGVGVGVGVVRELSEVLTTVVMVPGLIWATSVLNGVTWWLSGGVLSVLKCVNLFGLVRKVLVPVTAVGTMGPRR